MQTTRTLRLLQPSRVDRLLHAFTTSCAGLTDAAFMVRDWGSVPLVLHQQISKAERIGYSWECWVDGQRTWLYVAEMATELSRDRGCPVLKISRHEENGQLQDAGYWVSDREQRWRRLED